MRFESVFLRSSPFLEWSVSVRYPSVFNKFVKILSFHIILQLRVKIFALKRIFSNPHKYTSSFPFSVDQSMNRMKDWVGQPYH